MKDASERATEAANAIAEGIDCLARIRALREAAPVVDAAEVARWRDVLEGMQRSLEETAAMVEAGVCETSLRVDGELVRSVEEVRACLAMVAPGVVLPGSLFDLVDVAWGELGRTASP